MDNINLKDKLEVVIKNEADQEFQEDEISLREILESLIKGKKIIYKTAAVVVLVALLFTMVTNPDRGVQSKAETIVAFNFDGVEKGLDPHGKRFDVGKIKSPVVLDKVVESMKLAKKKITVDDIRNNIEITPIIPGKIVEKVQNLIEAVPKDKTDVANSSAIQELEDYVYYPTQFKVTMKVQDDWHINNDEGQQLLQSVIDEYTTYFYDTYSDREVLADAIAGIDYSDYDYPEIPLIMRSQINTMQSYLSSKKVEAPEFRSKVTGLSFNDIIAGISLIEEMDLNDMNSIISSYRITKDKDRLLKSYEYRIKTAEVNMAKSQDESRQAGDVRDKYQKDKSIMIMGGAATPDTTLESDKSSPMYDELAKQSLDAGVSATDALHDIDFLKQEMALYQTDADVTPEVRKVKTVQADNLIKRTDKKLRNWINLTNKTLDDYFETKYFERAIMQPTPVEVSRLVMDKLPLNLAIGLLLGLMLGAFAALFKGYWRKSEAEEDIAEKALEG